MLQPARAVEVAETFDLGGQAVLTGPVAAGRLGDVWRLSSERGDYAVKDARFPVDPAEVAADAAYQDRVRSHSIPMPAVVRTPRGEALATTEADRADNAAWVGEFLDEPVTVETVEQILDVAR